ncbi:AMP-binding enzyme [Bacillus sp. M6-12]|uniref:AMP-binding enzyme n=1 Tax=Bacillus sp. M6-12 TaxID=2054166 RepID=UPI0021557F4A|nr:hypothetical protein [Bacillus sp. M6-12]
MGGYYLYPHEIEEIFYTYPSVMDIPIVGLPDSVLGEISCAAILMKPGYDATVEDMKIFIAERVADYKVPDKILFMENLSPHHTLRKNSEAGFKRLNNQTKSCEFKMKRSIDG